MEGREKEGTRLGFLLGLLSFSKLEEMAFRAVPKVRFWNNYKILKSTGGTNFNNYTFLVDHMALDC